MEKMVSDKTLESIAEIELLLATIDSSESLDQCVSAESIDVELMHRYIEIKNKVLKKRLSAI